MILSTGEKRTGPCVPERDGLGGTFFFGLETTEETVFSYAGVMAEVLNR